MLNPVLSKLENNNLTLKTARKVKLFFSRRKKLSFLADTKLQVDQIKKK